MSRGGTVCAGLRALIRDAISLAPVSPLAALLAERRDDLAVEARRNARLGGEDEDVVDAAADAALAAEDPSAFVAGLRDATDAFRRLRNRRSAREVQMSGARFAGSGDEIVWDPADTSAEERERSVGFVDDAQRAAVLELLVAALTPTEEHLVRRLFGLGVPQLSLREMAAQLGRSPATVRRLESVALMRLAQAYRARFPDDYRGRAADDALMTLFPQYYFARAQRYARAHLDERQRAGGSTYDDERSLGRWESKLDDAPELVAAAPVAETADPIERFRARFGDAAAASASAALRSSGARR